MKITVTQDHIDRGKRNDPSNCAICLALRDAGVVVEYVTYSPDHYTAGIYPNNSTLDGEAIPLPNVATKFMDYFDSGRAVRPFTFALNLGNK